jgi:site-specific DNA-adenine methylase
MNKIVGAQAVLFDLEAEALSKYVINLTTIPLKFQIFICNKHEVYAKTRDLIFSYLHR